MRREAIDFLRCYAALIREPGESMAAACGHAAADLPTIAKLAERGSGAAPPVRTRAALTMPVSLKG